MEAGLSIPRAVLVAVQLPGVSDPAHAASMEELSRFVKKACSVVRLI